MKVLHSIRFKKLVACILSVVMICTILFAIAPSTVYAGSIGYGPFDYVVLPDGTAELTEYLGSNNNIHIPETIDGYNVSSIGDECFYNKTSVETVDIYENITSIGDYVFRGCSSLSYIEFHGDDLEIGNLDISDDVRIECNENSAAHRYAERTNHRDLRLLDNVFSYFNLADGTVEIVGYWRNIETIEIPQYINGKQVTVIGEGAFYATNTSFYDEVRRIIIPDGVTTIEDNAFYFPTTVDGGYYREITVPDSVHSFGFEPFNYVTINCNADSYTHLYCCETEIGFRLLDCDYKYVIQSDGTAIIKDWYGDETEIVVPSVINGRSVISIDGAFRFEDSLESVVISNGITSIGQSAFEECDSLKKCHTS